MEQAVEHLIELLDLEEIELNHYRGVSPNEGWQRVYGGQVISQALVAASRTVSDDRLVHSLHGYFLRAGATDIPILYKVDGLRDGRSFTTRRVVAIQKGEAIFSMSLSFQVDEPGMSHQAPMPEVPGPDGLPSETEVREAQLEGYDGELPDGFTARERPFEIRPINPYNAIQPKRHEPEQLCWMRCRERLPDQPRLHQSVLAYLSDWTLLDTATYPHAISYLSSNVQMASLDHAMWFHRPFRADDWLLYVQDSPSASGARGLNRGLIYDQQGVLVASTMQEGLMRVHEQAQSS